MLNQNQSFAVDYVDLKRYMGRWFEIARLPTYFERDCESVYADYSIQHMSTNKSDIRVHVKNQCTTKSGEFKSIDGIARITDTETCSKLQVSFAPLLPWFLVGGSYWILSLDRDDYSWAMVGNPQKTYLWILSRKPFLDWGIYRYLINEALIKGFDVSKLILTNQRNNNNMMSEPAECAYLNIDPLQHARV